MERKKIAIIGFDAYPIPSIRGGAVEELMTVLLNQNEIKKYFDFTVYTIEDEELEKLSNFYNYTEIVQINRGGVGKLLINLYRLIRKLFCYKIPYKSLYMHRINKLLRKKQYDVVFFATNNYQVAQTEARLKSHILYGVYSDYLNKNSYGINYIKKKIDSFVAIKYIGQRLVEELGNDTKVSILEGCCDLHRKSLDEKKRIRELIRAKHSINDDEIVVLYCGRLSPEKGPLELIQAIQCISDCKLIIVGGSNFSQNERNSYIDKLHREADICKDRIIFTGYIPNHDDMIDYMYASDIGVVPSICNEAGSTALVEFRVAGLPTVISNMGGMPNYAGKETTLVEYNERYISNLSNAIADLVYNEKLRHEYTDANFDDLRFLSRELYFERFKNMIDNIMNSAK